MSMHTPSFIFYKKYMHSLFVSIGTHWQNALLFYNQTVVLVMKNGICENLNINNGI